MGVHHNSFLRRSHECIITGKIIIYNIISNVYVRKQANCHLWVGKTSDQALTYGRLVQRRWYNYPPS